MFWSTDFIYKQLNMNAVPKTHMAELLHMGHQQGEAVSKGRVILCADLFDQWTQQHLPIISNGQDGCQLDRCVTQSWHYGCQETAAGCTEISLSDILKYSKNNGEDQIFFPPL